MIARLALLVAAFPSSTFALPASAASNENGGDAPGAAGDGPIVATTATLDPGIRRMIETAIAKGNDATVTAVLTVARQAAPDAKEQIDALEQQWRTKLATQTVKAREEHLAQLRAAGPLKNWKGEVELGISRSTGTTAEFGLLGSLDVKREGIDWTHELSARAEVQSTNGQTTTQRLFAAWQPNRRFPGRAYSYGLVQYEHDPFAGYDDRYTLGVGLGYRVLAGDRLKLELEGGPVLRRVNEVDGTDHSRFAGRGSLNLDWRITPTLSFTQKTAVYLEGDDGNIVANTGLDTKLIGNLKARFSYNVQYERRPPIGTSELSTQSRATFVYGF